MLLFLDLDGVLRRQNSALYRLEADCLAAFEDALRWIPEAEVVSELLLIDPTRGFDREAANDVVTMARRIAAEAPLE